MSYNKSVVDAHSSAIAEQLHSILDYIRYAISEFNQHDVYFGHGTENAWEEANRLVFSALSLPVDMSASEANMLYPCLITNEEKQRIIEWIQARCVDGIPLPYLTNQAWFAGMPFYIDQRALIPRSPFAELISKRFENYLPSDHTPLQILDMCTGSACIAIALAHRFEQAQVDAVDIDEYALEVASINIDEYQLSTRVFPIKSDLFENLGQQKYDLVIVNPPYVDSEDMQDLPREYLHEPETALASGQDGLDLTMKILKQISSHMTDTAWLFIEIGNSEVNFTNRFPGLKVQWCELENGGSGIFAINKSQLDKQQNVIEQLA